MDAVESFGKYKVLRPLGGGGMATVYLAVDPNGAQVALKVPHAHFAMDQEFRRRIELETYRRWLRGILFVISLILIAQFFFA